MDNDVTPEMLRDKADELIARADSITAPDSDRDALRARVRLRMCAKDLRQAAASLDYLGSEEPGWRV